MVDQPPMPAIDTVASLVHQAGVRGRGLRELIALLTDTSLSLEELIQHAALPRRSVEALLRALAADLDTTNTGFRINPDQASRYRDRFGHAHLTSTRLADPLAELMAAHQPLLAQIDADIAAAPRSRQALDHVSATADTVLRRALWLNSTFDLAGRRMLCIGDHDLTSLALATLHLDIRVTVVDVDERILEFIDTTAKKRGLPIECYYADFRFGLPEAVTASADAVFTDPPYTPEGIQLFLGRGLQGLRDRTNGRLILAYGFSQLTPALGVKVQHAIHELDLAFTAILPAFNRYHGAQAVGSASDLYLLQPTNRTWQVLDRKLASATTNIYTHGRQSLEAAERSAEEALATAHRLASADLEPTATIAINTKLPESQQLALRDLFASGIPAQWLRRSPAIAVADLTQDPGPWLFRYLLAVNVDRTVIALPKGYPKARLQETAQLVQDKYIVQSLPGNHGDSLLVTADSVRPTTLEAATVRHLLDRAHGKVGNTWRDGLIKVSRNSGSVLTKNEARSLVDATDLPSNLLESRLLDIPRHQLSVLFAAAATSALKSGNRG